MQELEMMRALVEDEYEETQVSLNQTKREIRFANNCITAGV